MFGIRPTVWIGCSAAFALIALLLWAVREAPESTSVSVAGGSPSAPAPGASEAAVQRGASETPGTHASPLLAPPAAVGASDAERGSPDEMELPATPTSLAEPEPLAGQDEAASEARPHDPTRAELEADAFQSAPRRARPRRVRPRRR